MKYKFVRLRNGGKVHILQEIFKRAVYSNFSLRKKVPHIIVATRCEDSRIVRLPKDAGDIEIMSNMGDNPRALCRACIRYDANDDARYEPVVIK